VVDPAFRAGNDRVGGGSAALGSGEGGGGGGGAAGGGLGASRTEVEQVLANFGASFQPGPTRFGQPSVFASMGGAKLELLGPPNQLMGMVTSATGPAPQIEMMIGQQRMFLGQMSPEAGPILNAALDEAKANGHSKKDVAGVATLEITYKPQGENVQYEFKLLAK
jgi:hypothetical protein